MVLRERKASQEFLESTQRGLCPLCVHVSTCTFPREPGRPIRNCEEFEGASPRPSTGLSVVSEASSVEIEASHEQTAGLCRYCERFESCTFPKPEGGVWHCEEYT